MLISSDTTAQKFISADFSATNDKLLVTLGDDNSVVVWQFDKVKCLAFETMQLPKDSIPRQGSFNNQGSQLSIVVVGRDVYKFFTLSETNVLKCTHQSFMRKDEANNAISTNFICHTWLNDGRFIVCTDSGQILLFESLGDFKNI